MTLLSPEGSPCEDALLESMPLNEMSFCFKSTKSVSLVDGWLLCVAGVLRVTEEFIEVITCDDE